MLRKDLAAALGISERMLGKLAQRGMPVISVDAAKQWRSRNLEVTRTKDYRAGGNSGQPMAKRSTSRQRAGAVPTAESGESVRGAAELDLFISAALFAEKFGIERFGPLVVHIACLMSDEGHDIRERSIKLGNDKVPQAIDDAWAALDALYFEWLPVGSSAGKQVEYRGASNGDALRS